ncbi:MAG TPA: hypothetical protein VMM78_13240 [Thermomicrobiales bacterium]|nr:hypothetical protein [Thermomicrobiales bacterium]
MELLAGLILSLTAAVVGVWQVTKRDRPLHGPLDDGSFGLPRLQRWDESYRPPRMQRLRSRLPRLEISRVLVMLTVVLALAGGVTYFVSRSNSQDLQQSAEAVTILQRVEAERQRAATLADPEAAYAALSAAEAMLAMAPEDGVDAGQLAMIQAQLAADIARVTLSQRLSNVQIVGGAPPAPSGARSQLVSGGGNLYLLADAVYQVDVFSSTLIRLLATGDVVDGAAVGALLGATWREDRLIAIDSTRSYAFDASRGVWVAEQLAALGDVGYDGLAAIATFDRNLYIVTPESGQILKFQAGAYDGTPEDWSAGVASPDLNRAIDMAIDGHVLVLLDDGRVLDFFRSRLEAAIVPRVIPPLEDAASIFVPTGGQYIYVLDAADGRIVRLTRDGEVAQQLTSPLSAAMPILFGAIDMTVDESAGLAYILARDTIFTVRLPAPPQ